MGRSKTHDEPDPSGQFQIGETVIYSPASVITEVIAYDWIRKVGGGPEISRYKLSCGIFARKDDLEKLSSEARAARLATTP